MRKDNQFLVDIW